MSLAERLKTPNVEEKMYSRNNKAWDFMVEPSPHDINTQAITLSHQDQLTTEEDWTQAVKDMGGIVADGYRVRLVEMRHNTHGWTRESQGKDAVTAGTWFYRFMVEPVGAQYAIDELLKSIGRRKAPRNVSTGPGVFHYLAGDVQLGKVDGDGTDGIVRTFERSVDAALTEFKQLRRYRNIGIVHLAFLGDFCEGNQSQNGRSMWRTELTVTEQVRVMRRLILHTVDQFAPLVESLEMDSVGGNHDDVQRFQTTRSDDNHATEAAIAVDDAMKLNPAAYGHVSVFVPPVDQGYMTRTIGDTTFTMTHGHQWQRGKATAWWSGQAFNWQAAGASQYLLHGHWHTASFETKKDRTIICTPTYESESTWWKEKTGDLARRGGIIMTTRNGEFRDFAVV